MAKQDIMTHRFNRSEGDYDNQLALYSFVPDPERDRAEQLREHNRVAIITKPKPQVSGNQLD